MSAPIQLSDRRIDKTIPVPYYYQIAEILRDAIAESPAAPGEHLALASENELCSLYGVTRATVRHALALLEREGLIYREKGRGTSVSRRRVQLDLTRLTSTTEDMQARGWLTSTHVLGVGALSPFPHVRHQLRLSERAQVWEVHRLRLADNEPISLQWSYLPCERTPGLDQKDLALSLYYIMQNDYGIRLCRGEQVVRTRGVTAEEGHLLDVAEGAPVFVIDRTTYDRDGTPAEYLHSLWRGDRYDMQVRLTGEC